MAQVQFRLLIHKVFTENQIAFTEEFGKDYEESLIKQFEKAQNDPFNAGERYHCDIPEIQEFVRKNDIGGRKGPKLFWFLWADRELIIPFHITLMPRSEIKHAYRNIRWREPADAIFKALKGLPDTADEFEIGLVVKGRLMIAPASDYL